MNPRSQLDSSAGQTTRLPVLCDYVPEEFQQLAKRELKESEENVKKGLERLKECISRENLPFDTDDYFLMQFLRGKKYDFKKAEDSLRSFVLVHEMFRNFLQSKDLKKIEKIIDDRILGFLPFRDSKGRIILYSRLSTWNRDLYDEDDLAACLLGLTIFVAAFPLSTICGINYISDATVNSVYELYSRFRAVKNYATVLKALPYRFQRSDIFNENVIYRYLFTAVRPLLPEKNVKRMNLHGKNVKALCKVYPPSMLPFEFGGTMGPLSNECFKGKFLEFWKQKKSELNLSKEKEVAFLY